MIHRTGSRLRPSPTIRRVIPESVRCKPSCPSSGRQGLTGPVRFERSGTGGRGCGLIQTLSAGVDWIVDTVPAGVVLCSARGAHDTPVAEWVMAAMLAGLKDLATARDNQREERWINQPVARLAGSTVLLLGYGSIGRAVEDRLEPFGARILRIARRPRDGVATMDALPELLPQADVIVVLLALTPKTQGTIDAGFLGRMRRGALLVTRPGAGSSIRARSCMHSRMGGCAPSWT